MTSNEELGKYELMLILMPDLSSDDTKKELKKVKKLIKDSTGEIYHEDIWDIRDLAYTIKKQDKGYYIIYYFTLEEPRNLVEMEKELLLNNIILRHMVVKSPKGYELKKLSDLEYTEGDRRTHRVDKDSGSKSGTEVKKVQKPKDEVKTEEVAPKIVKEEKKKDLKEKKEEKEEEAPKEEKKTMDISDLDSQLESLLDDPDINIKL
ncbi:30S ribosomal protein S6 [bacterium]|nr:30S ribosomal protein S6 [bacterium]